MFHLMAGAVMAVTLFFHGLVGGHATSTPPTEHPKMASTTQARQEHMASTSLDSKIMPLPQGIAGKVTAVNGTTLTVLGKASLKGATTTFTVDASSAKVLKDNTKNATLTNVLVGDTIIVEGKVSGTTVTAKAIFDGKLSNHPAFEQMVGTLRERAALTDANQAARPPLGRVIHTLQGDHQ